MNDEQTTEIKATPSSAMQELDPEDRANVDLQVSTAKHYPRSIKGAFDEMVSTACMNEAIATACFYSLKRGSNVIEGPSVRLAEISANAWGNLRVDTKILPIKHGDRFVKARSIAWDLEKNVAIGIETQRRITDKNGNLYRDDMVGVTSNAAASIAFRNAVFKVVPRTLVDFVLDKAREVAFGNAESFAKKRTQAVQSLIGRGISEGALLAFVDKPSVFDLDAGDLTKLTGAWNRVRDGEAFLEEMFPEERPDGDEPAKTTNKVAEKIKNRKPKAKDKPKSEVKATDGQLEELVAKAKERYGYETDAEVLDHCRNVLKDGGLKSLGDMTDSEANEVIEGLEK